jgi:hypothetical protein
MWQGRSSMTQQFSRLSYEAFCFGVVNARAAEGGTTLPILGRVCEEAAARHILKLLADDVGPSAWTAEFHRFQASIGQITFPF